VTAAILAAGGTSTHEAVVFWVLAPLAVLGALGMVFVRSAVHSAVLLAVVMLSLAAFYTAESAPFLAVVQVVVYTGAVLMLFLFVLMLIGVDTTDSLVETLRGQRVAAAIVAAGFALLLVVALAGTLGSFHPKGVAGAEAQGVEQQGVVGHVGVHASLAQGVDGFSEVRDDGIGAEAREAILGGGDLLDAP